MLDKKKGQKLIFKSKDNVAMKRLYKFINIGLLITALVLFITFILFFFIK